MLIVVITATIMFLLVNTQQFVIARTNQTISYSQSTQYVYAVENWAIGQLQRIVQIPQEQQKDIQWPLIYDASTIPGGTISGHIYDLQGMVNLNNLLLPNSTQSFSNFLIQVAPDMNQAKADAISQSLRNYLLKNSNSSKPSTTLNRTQTLAQKQLEQINARDNDDQTAPTTDSTTNSITTDRVMTEARLLPPMTAEFFRSIVPYITLLPAITSININTASAQVITSTGSNVTLDEAKKIIETRTQLGGFASLDQLPNRDENNANSGFSSRFTLQSEYFLVEADVQINQQRLLSYSILQVTPGTGKITVKLIKRTRGTR